MILTGTQTAPAMRKKILSFLSAAQRAEVLKACSRARARLSRFQVLAKGETELPVPTNPGVAELRNQHVEITWK